MSRPDQILWNVLRKAANQYPADMAKVEIRNIPRIAYNMEIGIRAASPKSPNEMEICDLGGGIGLFSVGCAAYGFKRVVLVDDFNDPVNQRLGPGILDLHRRLGIQVFSRNVVEAGVLDLEGRFDIVTTFDSMEHWHNSPKKLFREVAEKLKPDGVFVLGVPNCVNLRKRLSALFGFGKWTEMRDWYETAPFRGHVREPDVDDLLYIARDMGLSDITIEGRNWQGSLSANPAVVLAAKVLDYPLRVRPTLCSDIYLVGKKTR